MNNKNAFLNMMEGALTGKTGFTNGAGYCYVGALEREGKRLVAVVLACGWPNHKTWKWSDMKKLMNYGLANFHKEEIGQEQLELSSIPVTDGQTEQVGVSVDLKMGEALLKDSDEVAVDVLLPDRLAAPAEKGELVGTVIYYINGEIFDLFPICLTEDVKKIDYLWCARRILHRWLPE